MTHAIYNTETKQFARIKGNGAGVMKDAIYKSESAAKAGLTRIHRKVALCILEGKRVSHTFEDVADWAVISLADYRELDTMVERTNLMSGEKYMEDINTPRSSSPSSELYWSM